MKRKWRHTCVPRQRGLLGQIQEGGCGHHVVEDGADACRVRHHHHAQHIEKHHVAVAILGRVGQHVRHQQVPEHSQDVVPWKQEEFLFILTVFVTVA